MKNLSFLGIVAVPLVASVFSGCSSPAFELTIPDPPRFEIHPSKNLTSQRVSGQVFWTTPGRETVKGAGLKISIYDGEQLEAAKRRITDYTNDSRKTLSELPPGLSSTGARARVRLQESVDGFWEGIGGPHMTVYTDAEGRFDVTGNLPTNLGIYCLADISTFGTFERRRWAISEANISDRGRIVLSNHNELGH
jgi:hypothetical protein